MKRVSVNEAWRIGCHLCESNCAFANSDVSNMAAARKGKPIFPHIHIAGNDKISYFETIKKVATSAAFFPKNRQKKFGGVI